MVVYTNVVAEADPANIVIAIVVKNIVLSVFMLRPIQNADLYSPGDI